MIFQDSYGSPKNLLNGQITILTLSENFQQPIIYECHVGMAQEDEGVGTYREFADEILPRIKEGGYNAIQLMAIMEHPYYGSFGYHVSNFFAPTSRFGTPEDLKYLVNKAHSMGHYRDHGHCSFSCRKKSCRGPE